MGLRAQVLDIPPGGYHVSLFCEEAEGLERIAKSLKSSACTGLMQRRKNAGRGGKGILCCT